MNREDVEGAVEEVCREALRKITPSRRERVETLQFSKRLSKSLAEWLRNSGIRADVRVQGSIAKDTWLAGEKDIDVFISLPATGTKEILLRVLDVVKSFVGERWIEAYAEHPYIEAKMGGYKIDFVPCFKVKRAEEAASSVDRTPLHTSYIKRHLDQQAKDEVRLLKQFMRGIGTYGAEIKVKGFSGYLCELLILHYRSFLKTLQGIASWRFGQVVDVESLYDGRVDEARRMFNAPLIVVDPVDANRNVAAAVSKDRMGELMMATRLFLANPEPSFFFPDETTPLSTDALTYRLERLEFNLIFVVFRGKETAPDVLWGELYKTAQALRKLLSQNDFQVLRDVVWSDEKKMNILVFGLEASTIPPSRRHMGPPLDSREATSFIDKYAKGRMTVIGPWIEGDRWVVGVRRRYVDAALLLRESLRSEVENLGVASGLAEGLREAEVYADKEVLALYSANQEFARFLTDFLRGRPKWMK